MKVDFTGVKKKIKKGKIHSPTKIFTNVTHTAPPLFFKGQNLYALL
jgi:hypothetical protein